MTTKQRQTQQLIELDHLYRCNYIRHLLALSHHFRSQLMHHLREQCGFSALRINWEPMLSLPGREGIQIGKLAKSIGISKQNCDQQLRAIERAGFLRRSQDPNDRRAKRVTLTQTGRAVVDQAQQQLHQLDAQLNALLCKEQRQQLWDSLYALNLYYLETSPAPRAEKQLATVALLIRLASHSQRHLMQLTQAAGHNQLQLSYEQVLNHIGLQGATITQLAEVNDVSQQAIVRIVNELEGLSYVGRIAHPQRARSKLIVLSDRGLTLLRDANNAMEQIQQLWQTRITATDFNNLQQCLLNGYRQLAPKDLIEGDDHDINIFVNDKTNSNSSQQQLLAAIQSIISTDSPVDEEGQNLLLQHLGHRDGQQFIRLLGRLRDNSRAG
ncbi:DNA-binding MarR family transcriptional regulator [Sinobacterium caligoides]|uniref:DNA-binding MarR family transcriptional regulator n=1 Tax=Sinobacterium caligoides TaxID=933926 RepID=A0A3N2DPH4_9GAMM|nr:MarR family transcriptional regulator [Sinobacterium caligoides]ROS01225.1 DNA-binding MarR family transcriptional regulator [Sinobacterium caligoides]